ncbi:MAG: thrombospondin type 3 repeat-containing protein, partial [Nitrospirota bacterium]
AGDDDQWTFLDDAEILQGADPVLLFGFEPSEHAIWGFTLVASRGGLAFADQQVAVGTITAERPLLWLANDLEVGRVHETAGDLTYTPNDASAPRAVHLERTITLVGKGPHQTRHSYFSDVLHFRIVDTVTPVPPDDTSRSLTYNIYLARAFGPVECWLTDGVTTRHTEIERAVVGGHNLPDTDDDGVVDVDDNCPRSVNPSQADLDGDHLGDVCDPDVDGDGVANDGDGSGIDGDHPCTIDTVQCDDAFPDDPSEVADADRDGLGNNADPDDDNDSVADVTDNCPLSANPDQANHDADGLGDRCDPDDDNDGAADDGDGSGIAGDHPCTTDTVACDDALPFDPTEQMDADGDGIGNTTDPDDDNDGVADDGDGSGIAGDHPCTTDTVACDDALPFDPTEQADFDGDGLGNHADPDDDNDGVPDGLDFAPLDPAVSEGPYRVYLWVTDPADWTRRLYAIDPDDGTATEIPAPNPERPGELWDLAVHPALPGNVTPPRVAFLSPGTGATPSDPAGDHLWASDEDGVRDLTPVLNVPVTGAVWRNDGEAIYFTRGDRYPDPHMAIEEVDRLGEVPVTPVVLGEVWEPRFSPDQRYLAYTNTTGGGVTASGLRLLDRDTGLSRAITPVDVALGEFIFYVDRTPEFSADGTRVVVAGTRRKYDACLGIGAPETGIWVFDTASATVVRKVTPADFGLSELQIQLPQGYRALSPDGGWLAVEILSDTADRLAALDLKTGTIATIAPSLPAPATLPAHWAKRAGGWTVGSPFDLILALTGGDGQSRPTRLATNGAPAVPLLGADHHSDGPLLLSPGGRRVFFVEDGTVWRVEADGSGLAPLTSGRFTGLELRLEVAQ